MFTDMKEALEAEALQLTPTSTVQAAAASARVACHARDKDDLAELLGALGLPRGEDDLVRLLPHIPTPDTPTTGDLMSDKAFTAVAVSMLNNGDSPEHVRGTLGLSESELAEAVQHAGLPAAPDTDDGATTPKEAVPAPNDPAGTDGIEALLTWAENHTAASIRNRAARVRSDLTELTERHATDAAQREAEERVAKAKAELESAQAQLREVKTGGRAATPLSPTAAQASVPTGRRSKEELAAIRTWARVNGYQVADRGTPAKAVLDAYDVACSAANLAEAS
ncbi:histone-like nucleoid-structuring protein Lsr2 [Streptomyces sp. NPDC094472]|uniref:Lsr2 family DNA-binding protein n=1 Tax=Streptomyces sp. NPDC094472 TaxID=3155080 RepID=UPI00331E13B1